MQETAEQDGEQSIEASLEEIQKLLDEMGRDGVTLEESFACYEKGIRLLRQVNERIDRVEKKVQMLTEDGTLEAFE
ncbi:MAG: exodeoxyribonuclease VII small subunit [Lachnospiraceae bacterium]|nr:exodeoxyribonuclease VII small subunit [Lachnospiraceae bacterium]MBQ6363272.1 exodeoxyribonuclease VII small subunit [Lachnospiraceae bacterium]MBR2996633.1 exodeoxyribonuclease VII small subunit [Lachnospiraceae bacterium]